jgi:hypothetical protein
MRNMGVQYPLTLKDSIAALSLYRYKGPTSARWELGSE